MQICVGYMPDMRALVSSVANVLAKGKMLAFQNKYPYT